MSIDIVDLDILEHSPTIRYGHSCEIIGEYLYLFGGFDGEVFSNELHVLDLINMKWEGFYSPSNGIDGRHFHSCCSDSKRNRLLFFGGKNNGYMNDLFSFNVSNRKFESIMPNIKNKRLNLVVPSCRYASSSCYFNETMYIFGGYDNNGFAQNDLFGFDTETNLWKKYMIKSKKKITGRYHHSGVLFPDGFYYIIGGMRGNYTSLSDLWRINLKNIESTTTSIDFEEINNIENPIASHGHKAFLMDGELYMYGGRTKEKDHQCLLKLRKNQQMSKWEIIEDFPFDPKKLNLSYCTINVYQKNIFFFGGQERKGKAIISSSSQKKIKKIEDLPYDVVLVIFSFLSCKDHLSICHTSKNNWIISRILRDEEKIWKKHFENLISDHHNNNKKLESSRMKKISRERTYFFKIHNVRNPKKTSD